MQRPAPVLMVEAAPGCLAVDGDHLAGPSLQGAHLQGPHLLGEGGDEAAEAGLEAVRVEHAKQAREGVMAGNATLEAQKPAQEWLLGAPEHRHVDASLGAAQTRRQPDQQHLQQVVALGIARARVDQISKTGPKPFHAAIPPVILAAIHEAHIDSKRFYKYSLCDSPVRQGLAPCHTERAHSVVARQCQHRREEDPCS